VANPSPCTPKSTHFNSMTIRFTNFLGGYRTTGWGVTVTTRAPVASGTFAMTL